MDAAKFAELRLQMNQNNAEMTDFISELDSWGEDMREKEKQLKGAGAKDTSKSLPPLRNSLTTKKVKKKVKPKTPKNESQTNGNTEKSAKISAYDYHAWDKFDVDSALEEIDTKEKEKSSSSEYETDEEEEMQRIVQLAEKKKGEGNELFKAGRFDEAAECYTLCISLQPHEAVYHSNRAAALLKLGSLAAAVTDCDRALELGHGSTSIKARFRRASALSGLERYKEALDDFEEVLRLQPNNKQAMKEVDRLRGIVYPEEAPPSRIHLLEKPRHSFQRKALRRLVIEEVGSSMTSVQSTPRAVSSVAQKFVQQDDVAFRELLKSGGGEFNEREQEMSRSAQFATDVSSNGNVIQEISCSSKSSIPVAPIISSVITSPNTVSDLSESNLSPVHFQSSLRRLSRNPAALADLLLPLSPNNYPTVFSNALEVDLLLSTVTGLHHLLQNSAVQSSFVVDALRALAALPRFAMTVCFLSTRERAVLLDLVNLIEPSELLDSALKKKLCL